MNILIEKITIFQYFNKIDVGHFDNKSSMTHTKKRKQYTFLLVVPTFRMPPNLFNLFIRFPCLTIMSFIILNVILQTDYVFRVKEMSHLIILFIASKDRRIQDNKKTCSVYVEPLENSSI